MTTSYPREDSAEANNEAVRAVQIALDRRDNGGPSSK